MAPPCSLVAAYAARLNEGIAIIALNPQMLVHCLYVIATVIFSIEWPPTMRAFKTKIDKKHKNKFKKTKEKKYLTNEQTTTIAATAKKNKNNLQHYLIENFSTILEKTR